MFEFSVEEGKIVKENECHYKIIEAKEISDDDLNRYNSWMGLWPFIFIETVVLGTLE